MSIRHSLRSLSALVLLAQPWLAHRTSAQDSLREIASRPTVPSAPGVAGLLAADFDADGATDIVLGGNFGEYDTGVVSLLTAGSDGGWKVAHHWIASDGSLVAVTSAGEFGGYPLIAAASTDEVRLFAFPHLRPVASWPTMGVPSALAVRDIDGDGALEAVVSGSQLAVHDLWSGALLAQAPFPANGMHIAQLDADPALEIILDSTPGRIVDGASLIVDWQYAGSFNQTNVSGPVLEDGGFGFVSQTTAFRVVPYSPVWTAKLNQPARAVVEIDGDATPEVLFGNGQYYTPATGQIRYVNYACSNSEILVAQLTGSAEPEVVCGYNLGSDSSLFVHALDATQLWQGDEEPDFFHVANFADDVANGLTDTVWVSGGGHGKGKLHFSARLGDAERMQVQLHGPAPHNAIASPMATEAVQADGDPAIEYVVLAREMYTTMVFVVDGMSGLVQALNPDASGGFNRPAFFAHRYQSAGGGERVAAVFGDPESTESLVVIGSINPSTAAVEGMTAISTAHGRRPRASTLVNVDADATNELVVATESAVFAYDLESNGVIWSRPGGAEGVTSTTIGSQTLIHIVSSSGEVTQLDQSGGNLAGTFNVGAGASGLFAVPDASGLAIACADRRLVSVDLIARNVLASSRDLGARPCRNGALEFEPSPQPIRFIVGGNSGVYRFVLDLHHLFSDGLERASWQD